MALSVPVTVGHARTIDKTRAANIASLVLGHKQSSKGCKEGVA